MSPARVILVRHAEPSDEVLDRVYGRLDVELSARGAAHADELAAQLAAEPIARVYSSPLRRAVTTAAPLAAALGQETVLVEDLRELDFGELEGLTIAEAIAAYPAEAAWMTAPANASFPGGETVAALRERVLRAARELAARHAGETVAVFTHSVPIRTILAETLGMPPDALFRLDQSYGGISVVEWLDGHGHVRVVNATSIG